MGSNYSKDQQRHLLTSDDIRGDVTTTVVVNTLIGIEVREIVSGLEP